ncbi:leucine-rich repeats and immunoglobulin-like domains protein 1 isoform X2 [Ruditapes philippinarum]|uniref:leucine-rich repeats and immunoglobulin-like domains protein 1 isoform X2 n=1 Tax=Ruditapes philippinarum TaxID=129788 RepID=UPI00295A9B15|nr:leucine-rich repeats and immunoglobulin-like domains protein 1 isoform X2 [Ruditapes philippinarum]
MNVVDWRIFRIKCYLILCCFLQNICLVLSSEGPLPSFTNTPTNVVTHKGSVAILRCGVDNLGTKTVTWRKLPYNIPITVGKDQFLKIDRFKLFQVPYQGEWNLHIKNAQPFDSGTYECHVSLKGEKISRNITLTVLETATAPLIPSINMSGTQIVEKGNPIKLLCNATSGNDKLQSIDWFKDGNKLQTSYTNEIFISQKVSISEHSITSTLDIDKARMTDMGRYVCRASRNLATRMKVDVLNGKKAETYNEKRETHSEIMSGQTKDNKNGSSKLCTDSYVSSPLFLTVLLQTMSSIYKHIL